MILIIAASLFVMTLPAAYPLRVLGASTIPLACALLAALIIPNRTKIMLRHVWHEDRLLFFTGWLALAIVAMGSLLGLVSGMAVAYTGARLDPSQALFCAVFGGVMGFLAVLFFKFRNVFITN